MKEAIRLEIQTTHYLISTHFFCAVFCHLIISMRYLLDALQSSSHIINLYVKDELLYISHTHENHHFTEMPLMHDGNLEYFFHWLF